MASGIPVRVYVSVGANIDPETNIRRGLALLMERVPITVVSMFYRTPAIDRPAQAEYLNGVVALDTRIDAAELKFKYLRAVEQAVGRVRTADAYAARPLDLDILLYGNDIICDNGLVVPDPDIIHRPFLCAGLLNLEPALRLPGATLDLAQQIEPDAIAALQQDAGFTRALKEQLFHES